MSNEFAASRPRGAAFAAGAIALALSISGCAETPTTTGVLFAVQTETDGTIYRLRDAQFEIVGPTIDLLDSESFPADAELISADVDPGNYSVLLRDGWRLEQSTDGTIFADVAASLISTNPIDVVVSDGLRTPITFTFQLGDGTDVPMGPSGIDIDIDVVGAACPPPGPGNVTLCGAVSDLSLPNAPVPEFSLQFFDALELINGGALATPLPVISYVAEAEGTFVAEVPAPALGAVVIVANGPELFTSNVAVEASAGASIADVRMPVLPQTRLEEWSTNLGDPPSFGSEGLVVLRYHEPSGFPVEGVTATRAGSPLPGEAIYFLDVPGPLTMPSGGLDATGPNGAAIVQGSDLVSHSGIGNEQGCAWDEKLAFAMPFTVQTVDIYPDCAP